MGGALASRVVLAVWGSLGDASFAKVADGGVYFWGQSMLGDGDGDSSGGSSGGGGATPLPVEIAALRSRDVMQVASGGPHALALGGGDVFAWGAAAKGALGLQLAGAVLSVRQHVQSALVARSSPRGHPPLQKPTCWRRAAPWGPRGGPLPSRCQSERGCGAALAPVQ